MKPTTFVSAFDLHFPDTNWDAFGAMMAFLKANQVGGFVFGGDQFNNEAISHHTKGKGALRPTGQFLMDEVAFDKRILRPLEALLPSADKVWIVGNHDAWELEYEDEHPELTGRLQRTLNLELRSRGWQVVPLGHRYKRGKMSWIHGESIGTQHHAKRALELYCTNLNYGHHHTCQSATKVLSTDFQQKWVAQCNPILGNLNPSYAKGKPNGWVSGFTVTEFGRDGQFNNYPVIVTEGECSYGGKSYGTRSRKS